VTLNPRLSRTAISLVFCVMMVNASPTTIHAQGPARGILRAESLKPYSTILDRADRSVVAPGRRSPGGVRHQRSAVGWGILGGAIAGAAVSAVAADRYGKNEGGQFCTRCFALVSAIAVPAGAGLGALTGHLIDVARR
jgi:hypothetical protein